MEFTKEAVSKLTPSFFLILVFVNLYQLELFAQNQDAAFQHFDIEGGLSDNSVNCIVQDDDGFVWIGTDYGLNKYNGYSSKIYPIAQIDTLLTGISHINCAFKDSKGRLWFGSKGLILFYPKEDKFIVFQHSNSISSINHNDVFSIVEDENKTIWIGTRLGLARFEESTMTFTRFEHDTTGTHAEFHARNRIIDMIVDQHGFLWMTTLKGLYKFSLINFGFTCYLVDTSDINSFTANHLGPITFDTEGDLWVSLYGKGVFQFDTNAHQFIPVELPNIDLSSAMKQVNDMQCDKRGNIWVASSTNGLIVFNKSIHEWHHYVHDSFNPKSVSDNKILSLFEDKSGMMWVGTMNRGVDRKSPIREKFKSFILQPGKLNSLCEDDITCVLEDQNANLWIGSKSGLMYYDRKSDLFKCYHQDLKHNNSLLDNRIYAIALDSLNHLWVGTNEGLNYYLPERDIWKYYKYDEKNTNGLPGRVVFDLIIRSNGELWAATSGLMCKLKSFNGVFENQFNNANIAKLKRSFYCTVFEDSYKTMWVSTTRAGILHLGDGFEIISNFSKSSKFKASIVHQFAEDVQGNIWMASNRGLYLWNRSQDSVISFCDKTTELCQDIKSVVVANHNMIWVSTAKGLFRFNVTFNYDLNSFELFTVDDGLQSNSFNNCSGILLKSGELFFGGLNGFNIFNPTSISYNEFTPEVSISSFKIFNKDMPLLNEYLNSGTILLSYEQNFFSFEMVALSYDHPEKNQFAYQLEGFDPEMIHNGTNRFAYYTNVPPGNYLLHIRASNNDGKWNKNEFRINLVIEPPYWKTTWFRILILGSLILLLYLIYTIRVNQIRKQEGETIEVNKKIAQAQLTALRAQMNPHFIFNTLNAIQQLISESEKEKALNYLSKFSKLIRLVLQKSDQQSNSIAVELSMLSYYLELEALRFVNKFTYHFDVALNINKESTFIPSMLLQPYVENAVIHGLLNKTSPGHLEIKLEDIDNRIVCTIVDNGIGRRNSSLINQAKLKHHESLGMKVTEERIHMIENSTNQRVEIDIIDLEDSHGNATGTKVMIKIPIEL